MACEVVYVRLMSGEAFGQFRRVGAIGHEPAPFEFFQDAHTREIKLPVAKCQFPIGVPSYCP
jgi:hypothetical protein